MEILEKNQVPRSYQIFIAGGGGGFQLSATSLAVSAGHGVDVACLNAFLAAALQRVVREVVLVQAPASAPVVTVPSAGVHVVDTGVSGGIAASVAGRVGELAAVCRERVVVGVAGRRSSAGGAASCQVMSPGCLVLCRAPSSKVPLVQQTSLDLL